MDLKTPKSATRFRAPETWLDPPAAATLVAAAADLTLVIGQDGIVRDVSVANADLFAENCQSWIGKRWADLVTDDSRAKVEQLIADAALDAKTPAREVNHLGRAGSFPIAYATMALGAEGTIVALGRDLRAEVRLQQRLVDIQRSMERDYARLRNAETRYRLLFQMATDPILIVDATSGRVTDTNPAAQRLIGSPSNRIQGRQLRDLFDRAQGDAVAALVVAGRTMGTTDETRLKLADAGAELAVSASMFRHDNAQYLLVRLDPGNADGDPVQAVVAEVVRNLPEAFAVISFDERILEVNTSFLEMTGLAGPERARGELIGRWLGRPGVDVGLLISNLREHHSIRDFGTVVRSETGGTDEAEVTAVALPNGDPPCIGLVIRIVRRRPIPTFASRELNPSVENLTQLIGSVPMKDLVRETTDMIEQMCIEAALKLTDDNRASAAQILGLSRQSLYAKLRRFGMGDLDGDADD
jgi:transcriptional regulator PpsR